MSHELMCLTKTTNGETMSIHPAGPASVGSLQKSHPLPSKNRIPNALREEKQ